jgi:hypothetical protein
MKQRLDCLAITHESVLTRFLPVKRDMAPLYPVFIDLYRPLNLGPSEMWVSPIDCK